MINTIKDDTLRGVIEEYIEDMGTVEDTPDPEDFTLRVICEEINKRGITTLGEITHNTHGYLDTLTTDPGKLRWSDFCVYCECYGG